MENKAGILIIVIMIIVLLVAGFFVFWNVNKDKIEIECEGDDECVRVQTTCCPCNMGGEEKCVPASEKAEYEEKLENCSEEIMCAAVYKCNESDCNCIDEKCAFKE